MMLGCRCIVTGLLADDRHRSSLVVSRAAQQQKCHPGEWVSNYPPRSNRVVCTRSVPTDLSERTNNDFTVSLVRPRALTGLLRR
jgi:hypothetical protein